MNLRTLIKALDNIHAQTAGKDFPVRGISCDSSQVENNYIFVAIRGNQFDGHKFVNEAVARGAKAVIVLSSEIKLHDLKKAIFIGVKDTRRALAKLAAEFYGNPAKKMQITGITGTNGKTTISYLIEAMLKEKHASCAVLGTINYRFKDKIIPAKKTTPGPLELQSLLSRIKKEGVKYVVMEVSSHALAQDRTEGIGFNSAIFTNLTQDHLDYHKNLDNYFSAKAKLFKGLGQKSFAVINEDDAYGRKLKGLTSAKVVTYGIRALADVTAKNIRYSLHDTRFILSSRKGKINLKVRLIGNHNVYNCLAVAAWALEEGIELPLIKSALEKFSFVPGRLEKVNTCGDFGVFVDYAHTEDALKNVIISLKKVSFGRIIVVFGCGGQRDKTKRPKMGRVVCELADYAIITNDNPRSENPKEIVRQIKQGMPKDNFCVVLDRRKAIKKALGLIKPNDIVLLAGKGHEDYQIFKTKTVHFDDREVARECLKLMK